MILQALLQYHHRTVQDGGDEVAPDGYEKKVIPFLILLNPQGRFVGLEDTRLPSGKKLIGRQFFVPKERERSGTNAWQKPNLLWDHYGYVLGHPKSDDERDASMARKQHGAFAASVKALHEKYPSDLEIEAVHEFLSRGDFRAVFADRNWAECQKIRGCNLSIRVEGRLNLVCENENVRAYVASTGDGDVEDEDDGTGLPEATGTCLVTGEYGPIARLHPRTPIQGTRSNAKIVSFQKNMGFDSYGKLQSYNAPIGTSTATGYTTALKKMLARESRQRIHLGDTTTVFWAERRSAMESAFADIFGEPAKGEPEQDCRSLIALFRAPKTGARAEVDPTVHFYVLGLAPNAARIAVRFWWAGTVGEVADNIGRHFDDLEMVKGQREWRTLTINSLLASTAIESGDRGKKNLIYHLGKFFDVPPNLAGDTMKAVLTGKPYPKTLLAASVRRCRAEREVTYTRAALIKAVIVRETRYYRPNEKEVGVSLDTTNTNPGYLLGRLFAVLEKIQEEASPGINTTIRDRFYGSASGTPVTSFPHLMKLKNHHLAKLENRGRAVNLEKQIGEIIDKLDAGDSFPAHLSLPDQGRFAVGYYHQRQGFFTKQSTEK